MDVKFLYVVLRYIFPTVFFNFEMFEVWRRGSFEYGRREVVETSDCIFHSLCFNEMSVIKRTKFFFGNFSNFVKIDIGWLVLLTVLLESFNSLTISSICFLIASLPFEIVGVRGLVMALFKW